MNAKPDTPQEKSRIDKSPLAPIFRWARSRSIVALPIIGVMPNERFAKWLRKSTLARAGLSIASSGRRADLLVVVGDISHKLAPLVQRAHARLSKPGFVLHVAGAQERQPSYALVPRLEEILPVDVRVIGDPPSEQDFSEALELLRQRIRRGEF